MQNYFNFSALLFFVLCNAQSQAQVPKSANSVAAKTARIILVGDSTMATRTGYGDAFCDLLKRDVRCINLARGGRSSASYRAEGLWNDVESLLRDGSSYSDTYVLIQFGHNDQPGKPGRSTDLAIEFPSNIARYVQGVRQLGGIPVLVTPLSRRTFRDGQLRNDLTPWADAIRTVALATSAPLIALNEKSVAALSAMGRVEADTLAEEPPNQGAPSRFDYTHLGAKGAALFAAIVATEVAASIPALAEKFRAADTAPTTPPIHKPITN